VKTASLEQAATANLPALAPELLREVRSALQAFEAWLERYGENSYDFQTFYAGAYGRFAKALYYRHRLRGTLAVAPIIACEAFVPSARRLFWVPQRFPIADAHYAMGFARLFRDSRRQKHLDRAVHFLEVLLATACPGDSGLGWGYPFDWVTIDGIIPQQTSLITTLPYVYEAFAAVHEVAPRERWFKTMQSIAQHALRDYRNHDAGDGAATCTYTPLANDRGQVVNANAYRAFLLVKAARDLDDEVYLKAAEPNLQFVLKSQNPDGSWYYAMDGRRSFIDHFHTCFVLKALAKIVELTRRRDCEQAIESGLNYYLEHLFTPAGIPLPFAKPPRLIVYRNELYDYAECVNLLTVVKSPSARVRDRLASAVADLLGRWRRPDGSFRSRKLFIGWDDVPMHRWAQAQMFRSLTGLLASPEQA
jgi:prenyltransferase/squalene oxidase-like repeat protein